MNLSPCKDCGNREFGCHSKCADYKDFREEIDFQQHNRMKYNLGYNVLSAKYWAKKSTRRHRT